MRISKRRLHFFLALVISGSLLSSCVKNSTPPTPWEQVTTYNAAFAESNQAIETGVQTLVTTGTITVAQAQPVIALTLRIAQIHQQLTAILAAGSSLSAANVATVQSLLQQIQSSAQVLVASGALGVKNPQTQNTVSQDISGIIAIGTMILNLLPQLEANPAPSTTPAAPAVKPKPSAAVPTSPSGLQAQVLRGQNLI